MLYWIIEKGYGVYFEVKFWRRKIGCGKIIGNY